MKKIFIIVGSIILLGLIALLLPRLYTSNWQKYESSKNSYSIMYPKNWEAHTSDDIVGLSSYKGNQGSFPPEGELWIDLWVQDLKTKIFDELVDEVAAAMKEEKKPATIKNADKAYTISSNLYIKKGNKFYSIVENGNKPTLRHRLDAALIFSSFELK